MNSISTLSSVEGVSGYKTVFDQAQFYADLRISEMALTHLCWVDYSTLSLWSSPFSIEEISGYFYFYYHDI